MKTINLNTMKALSQKDNRAWSLRDCCEHIIQLIDSGEIDCDKALFISLEKNDYMRTFYVNTEGIDKIGLAELAKNVAINDLLNP